MPKLPQEPGYYLWYICDLGYLAVGTVQVLKDPEKHHAYLRKLRAEKSPKEVDFYLYQNDAGEWLTMYHQARDMMPPVDAKGRPEVEGYRKFDFWWLIREKPPNGLRDPEERTMSFKRRDYELMGRYLDAPDPQGPEAQKLREENAANNEFITFADLIDRVRADFRNRAKPEETT